MPEDEFEDILDEASRGTVPLATVSSLGFEALDQLNEAAQQMEKVGLVRSWFCELICGSAMRQAGVPVRAVLARL